MKMESLQKAATIVKSGGVIVYPTESVYGLGCNPLDEKAVQKLLKAKNRPVEKGLILIASHLQQVLPFINPHHPDDLASALKTWPGFHTWVFPKSNLTPAWISGQHNSIAVRVSSHPTVVELCNSLNHALVSTSANITGQLTHSDIVEIKTVFGDTVDFFLDAPLGNTLKPSAITNAHTLKNYR